MSGSLRLPLAVPPVPALRGFTCCVQAAPVAGVVGEPIRALRSRIGD